MLEQREVRLSFLTRLHCFYQSVQVSGAAAGLYYASLTSSIMIVFSIFFLFKFKSLLKDPLAYFSRFHSPLLKSPTSINFSILCALKGLGHLGRKDLGQILLRKCRGTSLVSRWQSSKSMPARRSWQSQTPSIFGLLPVVA